MEGAGTGVDGGAGDGEDGDADADVDEVSELADAGAAHDDDEGREGGVPGSSAGEPDVVVRNEDWVREIIISPEQANSRAREALTSDEDESDDVDHGDAPEGHLDGTGHDLARVRRLGDGKTDDLRASHGESGSDEDRCDTLHAMSEWTGLKHTCSLEHSHLPRTRALTSCQ